MENVEKMYYNYGGFNEKQVLKYNLNDDDLHILSYILNVQNSDNMKKVFENGKVYAWLTIKKMVEDNPRLKIGERQMQRKLNELVDKKMLDKIVKCDNGLNLKRTYFKTSDYFLSLKFENGIEIEKEIEKKYQAIDIKEEILSINNNKKENDVNIIKDKKDLKVSFGTYGRIKLTQKEYDKLEEEFGRNKIEAQIKLVDEYIESNNNKNKYTNFNLVIRKSIRDNWFDNKNSNNQFKPRTQTAKEDEEGAI